MVFNWIYWTPFVECPCKTKRGLPIVPWSAFILLTGFCSDFILLLDLRASSCMSSLNWNHRHRRDGFIRKRIHTPTTIIMSAFFFIWLLSGMPIFLCNCWQCNTSPKTLFIMLSFTDLFIFFCLLLMEFNTEIVAQEIYRLNKQNSAKIYKWHRIKWTKSQIFARKKKKMCWNNGNNELMNCYAKAKAEARAELLIVGWICNRLAMCRISIHVSHTSIHMAITTHYIYSYCKRYAFGLSQ